MIFNLKKAKLRKQSVSEYYALVTDEQRKSVTKETGGKAQYETSFIGGFKVFYHIDGNESIVVERIIGGLLEEVENDQWELESLIDQVRDELGIASQDVELLISTRHTQLKPRQVTLKARGKNSKTKTSDPSITRKKSPRAAH